LYIIISHHLLSLRWMAPEVMKSSKYNTKADVFSFGLIAWEMFSGEIPFVNHLPVQAVAAMAYEHARPNTEHLVR